MADVLLERRSLQSEEGDGDKCRPGAELEQGECRAECACDRLPQHQVDRQLHDTQGRDLETQEADEALQQKAPAGPVRVVVLEYDE